MKKILLFHLLLVCPVVFLIWYFAFPGYIWFLESNSFFSTTPDFAKLQFSLPSEWASYAGAYLLQFFRYREGGALIETLFAVIVLLSADSIIACLFRNKRLLWLSFIPVAWFISGQFADIQLDRSLWWCAISVLLAIFVCLLTSRMKKRSLGERSFVSSPFFSYVVPILIIGFTAYNEVTDVKQKELESVCRLDRWAERGDWDALLQHITPEIARQSPMKLRWVLLALSEKGLLAERMFAYGVSDPSCFLYERQDVQPCHNFNAQFYSALGVDNEVIHHAFQAGVQSPHGMNFRSMRAILNACVRQGYNRMLAKYVSIMRHTSCHGKLVKFMDEYLASAGTENRSESNIHPFFIGARPFLSDMARLVDRHPENKKAIDYLLCGILMSKDMAKFYKIFSALYPSPSSRLPRYYEEALIVIATNHPEVLQRYPVSAERVKDFNAFQALLKGGGMNQRMLEVSYRDSFWLYYYCMQKVQK